LTELDGIFLARPQRVADGIRLAVKDLFDTAGLTTTYGSPIFAGHVPDETAEAVRRLEAAGYANVGKTNLHEFAYGVTSENPHFGTVPNPLAADRVAGGSSGGSAAAVAAGLADVALGSDSGGSIRIPAACCGVVGFKPTYGLVSLDGCFPLAPSFDHAGPIGPDVASCAEAMRHLAPGFEPGEVELADLAVGIAWVERAEPLVGRRVAAAAALFPRARPVEIPILGGNTYAQFMREVADVHRELFAEHADLYGEDVRFKIERCLGVSDGEAAAAARAREAWHAEATAAMSGLDLLLTPTLPMVAPPRGRGATGDLDVRERVISLTFAFNAFGWPALALPCGPAEDGLPASVQLAAPAGADALVLAAGAALERALASSAAPARD
jgi:aspartyl-tRNA(Asn)/glutamyl-tRNA(Gln) amidotransferase subunit A